MPLPTRVLDAARSPGVAAPLDELRERALAVLLSADLAAAVALVAWRQGEDVLVADAHGRVALSRDGGHRLLCGRDPVADDDPASDRGWPWAGARLHGLFDEPRAPDLAVVHTGRHVVQQPGEHGSLNGLQSRAPLLLSGAGVTARGVVAGTARTVDVAATLGALCGADLAGMTGRPLDLVGPGADHVVGLLWDGAPCGEVLALAADGQLPAVARLLARGCALAGGAVAEFPSVTLVNHTSALTGVGPGVHGIVHNAFWDRETGTHAAPNSAAGWHTAMQWLRPGVRTLWERLPVGATSACVNDPVDRGAGYSTFALVRAAGGPSVLSDGLPGTDDHASVEHTGHPDYAWGTRVDAVGLAQVVDLWSQPEPPRLTWWNTTLTDGAHHAGGPGSAIARASLRDADRRLGAFLDLLEQRGLAERTSVLLTADHGMQTADGQVTAEWDAALARAGIPFRDEADGFLYLGV